MSTYFDEEVARDLTNRFSYHPPKGTQRERYEYLRSKFKALAFEVMVHVPPGRERSKAFSDLQSAGMWANAGIACQETSDPLSHATNLTSDPVTGETIDLDLEDDILELIDIEIAAMNNLEESSTQSLVDYHFESPPRRKE